MKQVTLKLTTEELGLLTSLAADQLFRREFIDPKMPGYKSNPDEMRLGKAMLGRMRFMLDPVRSKSSPDKMITGVTN
jgi:hypothetical protein